MMLAVLVAVGVLGFVALAMNADKIVLRWRKRKAEKMRRCM